MTNGHTENSSQNWKFNIGPLFVKDLHSIQLKLPLIWIVFRAKMVLRKIKVKEKLLKYGQSFRSHSSNVSKPEKQQDLYPSRGEWHRHRYMDSEQSCGVDHSKMLANVFMPIEAQLIWKHPGLQLIKVIDSDFINKEKRRTDLERQIKSIRYRSAASTLVMEQTGLSPSP